MSSLKKTHHQDEPRCVVCSTSFYFRDPINPYGPKCPHLLQCGHSTCEGCLTAGLKTDSNFKCPVCSTVSESTKFCNPKNMKKSELLSLREEFPLNVYAVGQVSLKRNKTNFEENCVRFTPKTMHHTAATVCNECSARDADCSCRQCETDLCTGCFANIHNSVTLRKHEKISLREKQTFELFEDNMCQLHKGMFLNIFCKDCDVYICKECVVKDKHLEHHCLDTFNDNEGKLPELYELYDEANDVLKHLHATKKKVQQQVGTGRSHGVFDEEAAQVERRVRAHFSFLHGFLQRQEEHVLNKIRSVGDTTKASLQTLTEDLENNIKEVEKLLSLSTCTLTTSKISEIPLSCLVEKLRNITATPCHLVLDQGEVDHFELHIDSNVTEALANHCTVNLPTKRAFQLYSKDELPPTYVPENLSNEPDPFLKPDLNPIKTKPTNDITQAKLMSVFGTQSLSPASSQTSVKTKPHITQNSHNKKNVSRQNNSSTKFPRNNNCPTGSSLSLASQDSFVDRLNNIEALTEGSLEEVEVFHLTSPDNFYVQRLCNIRDIENIRAHFSKNANKSKTPPSVIEYGQMYLVLYSIDKKWYRGRVVRADGDNCDIFYVDYGNTEKGVGRNRLRDIPDKFAVIPYQALHCGLHNCAPREGNWDHRSLKLMTEMVHGKILSMYVERIDQSTGFHEVLLSLGNNSITDALILNGFATRTESTVKEGGRFKQPALGPRMKTFKSMIVKEKEVFDGLVSHINTPSHFYVIKIADGGQAEALFKFREELHDTYSRDSSRDGRIYTPEIGMPVAAKFEEDQTWYRATVINILDFNKVQVKYVDFGNTSIVNIDNIRKLQDRFLRYGTQAVRCSLNDIAPKHPRGWPASAKTLFEKMVHAIVLRVYVEKVKDDDTLSVILYEVKKTKQVNISGTLVKKGHAISTGQTSAQAEYECRPDFEVKNLHTEPMQPDSESNYLEFSGVSKIKVTDVKDQRTASKFPTSALVQDESQERPRMTSISSSQEEQEKPDNIGDRLKVEPLKVISPSEIYVATGKAQKHIKKLVKEMTLFYNSDQKLEDRDWNVNDICAVLKLSDGQWYRGVIGDSSHSLTTYKVYIKDIVELVDAEKSMLRTLEAKFFSVPDGSLKVHLGGLRVPAGLKTWPSSTSDYLRQLMEESEALYIETLTNNIVTDSITVCLWRKTQKQGGPLDPLRDEWCNVNESLINLGFALRDQAANPTMLSSPVENGDDYVQNWLLTSFQEAAETRIVSDLNETETPSVQPPSSIANRSRDSYRTRSNRGRFPSHRANYISRAIGPAEEEAIKDWKPALPFKKLNFGAMPTFVDYDCNIYIQDIEDSASTLDLLEKAFLSLYHKSEKRPYEEEYFEGQPCIAFYEVNQKWYRGRVMKINPKHIEVLFVDYGNVENMEPEHLRKQVTMGHIPIQCHRTIIKGIFPISSDKKWPINVLDFVHGSIVDQRCEVNLKEPTSDCNDYILIDLKLPGGQDLWETLLSMHYATYFIDVEKLEEDDEEIIEDFEIQQAPSNQTDSTFLAHNKLDVFSSHKSTPTTHALLNQDCVKSLGQSQGTSSWFDAVESETNAHGLLLKYQEMSLPESLVEFPVTVLTVGNYNSIKVMIKECDDPEIMAQIEKFNKMEIDIQQEVENLPMVTNPVKDLVCIGCFTEDGVWYRAIITSVNPDSEFVSVHYVDYGNTEDLPITRLKEIKLEWLEVPVQAFTVRLHNVREGPNFDLAMCSAALSSCFMDSPYTMAIQIHLPCLQVELYNRDGLLAYNHLLEAGLLSIE